MHLNISEVVKLSSRDLHLWEETLTAFSWHVPCFTHVLYEMLNPERTRMIATFLGTANVPSWFTAGTNGKRLFIVPDRFFALPLMQRVFILAHEVGHCMLGHIIAAFYYGKKGVIELGMKSMVYDDMLANVAEDFVINDLLAESRIGERLPGCLWNPSIGAYRESWIDVYEKLYREDKGGSKSKGDGKGGGAPRQQAHGHQKGFDVHLDFGEGEKSPEKDQGRSPERIEEQMAAEGQRMAQAVAAGMEVARARGKLPAAMQLFCEKILEPVVDWTEHLKAQFARKLGSGGYDFRRPDRRLVVRDIIAPGRSGYGANCVIIGADSSGSIYAVPELIARWMGEISGIMEEVKPREVHVVWCDAMVQRVDILTDPSDIAAMFYQGAKGGGGTSFVPVFEYAAGLDQEIDCLAYLTDGDGDFPNEAPRYPVIWGDISNSKSKYPFGDVVTIPVPRQP